MSDIKKEQESVFNALESLDSIIIDQKENIGESCLKCLGCCCIDSRNQYDWTSKDKKLFSAKEKSSCATRSCCNPNHALSLHVTPEGQKRDEANDVLVIDRPFKCCCMAVCCFRKEITISRPSQGKNAVNEMLLNVLVFVDMLIVCCRSCRLCARTNLRWCVPPQAEHVRQGRWSAHGRDLRTSLLHRWVHGEDWL
jgi:hypothetical protein